MIVLGLIFTVLAAAVAAAAAQLLSDEVLGWLALAPQGILWLVARRLPASSRKAIYEEEWLPELLFILGKADGRPITRLTTGIWFAVSLLRSASRVGRTIADVREESNLVPIMDGESYGFDDGESYGFDDDEVVEAEIVDDGDSPHFLPNEN